MAGKKANINYLRVFDSFPDMILLINPENYTVVAVNNGYLKKSGLSKDQIVGKRCFEVTHRSNRPCKEALKDCPLKSTLKTGRPSKIMHIHYDSHRNPYYTEVVTAYVNDQSSRRRLLLYISHLVPILGKLDKSVIKASKRYLRQIKSIAMKDPLTGIYNYQYLMEMLPAEVYRAKRYGNAFSLMIVDIDYFRSINDIYGHQVGDRLLAKFADFMKRHLRKSDILTRYSGEEFIILMPHTTKLDVLSLANRLITRINANTFRINKVKIKIKVSVGTATLSEDEGGDTHQKLLYAVDKALQRAKDSGGNVAIAYSDFYEKKKFTVHKMSTFEEINILKGRVKRLAKSVDQMVLESIYAFSKSLEARDNYTASHAEDMVSLVLRLGRELGLNKEMLDNLEKGAMLHDIGKIGISDAILKKKSRLTGKEYRVIKSHPKIGAEIIRAIHFLKDVVPIVLYHHEKWNGKGYPSGLKQREIPLLARIVSISDAYQALISDRPYRKAYSKKKALEILKKESGISFDKDLVDALVRIETKRKAIPHKHASRQ